MTRRLLLTIAAILLTATSSLGQDSHHDQPPTATTRSSPFDPPEADAFVADKGPGLDTGCTFNTDPEHPLIIDVLVDKFVGEVDADGYLVDPGGLIAEGIIPATVNVLMPAFDVDVNGGPPPERDEVFFNGEFTGVLDGDNEIWLLNSFHVDIRKIKFPQEPAPGGEPVPVTNTIQINVDVLSEGTWCTAIDWIALIIPIRPALGWTLDVKSGNGIRVSDPASNEEITRIYRQTFDQNCNEVVEIGDIDEYPFSGPARTFFGLFSGAATLTATLETCPRESMDPPDVKVEWQVLGTSEEGTTSWMDSFSGDVQLSMPDNVGVYTAELKFIVDGNDEGATTITRKLFVTRNPPLQQVKSPRRNWYELATAWASGKNDEGDVLQSVLAGTYVYGRQNWSYFNCGSSARPCCEWDELVAESNAWKFGNCYIFSDVFENMAATLGVEDGSPRSPTGSEGNGFLTSGAPSLDEMFPGNARPHTGGAYDRYLFSSHSLRKRGWFFPDYYDATFNGTYASENEFITYNVNGFDPTGMYWTTVEGAKLHAQAGNAYDTWGSIGYEHPPLFAGGGGADGGQASDTSDGYGDVGFTYTGNVAYETPDENSDGIWDGLVATVEVDVSVQGQYSFWGVLKKKGEMVANRPAVESAGQTQYFLDAGMGTHDVPLRFSGEQIYQSGLDGPYKLELFGIGESGGAPHAAQTPAYQHIRFGESPLSLLDVTDEAVDDDGDGSYELIEVTVDLDVRAGGEYLIQGSLSKGDTTIVAAADSASLAEGLQPVTLRFSGIPILRSGLDGPYEGTIGIIDAQGHTVAGIEFVTQSYASSDFSALIDFDGFFEDSGVDTNGNGLFDLLKVTFGATMREGGTFLLAGALRNPGGGGVVYAQQQVTIPQGPQQITIEFSGPLIHDQELDGPYEIEVALSDPETQAELDRALLGQSTNPYSYEDFEPFQFSDIILTGQYTEWAIDTNGNDLYDELHVEVEVLLRHTDYYEWSAKLADHQDRLIDFDSRESQLEEGIAYIHFTYDGRAIGEHGEDGPYFVKDLLMFGRTGPNIIVVDVAETRPYLASEFEGSALAGQAAAIPDEWSPDWLPTPRGYVRFVIGDLASGHVVGEIRPETLLFEGTVQPAFDPVILPEFPGFTGDVLLVMFDRHEALQALGVVQVGEVFWPKVTGVLETDEAFAARARIEIVEYPPAPAPLTWEAPNHLSWDYEGEVDPARYSVYGGNASGFIPDADHLLGTTTAQAFDVPAEDRRYFYVVTATDEGGHEGNPSNEAGPGASSSISEVGERPTTFTLGQCLPNPSTGQVRVRFGIPHSVLVRLAVFDARGQRIDTLFEEDASPGWHDVVWDRTDRSGRPVAEGVYFVRLQAGEFEGSSRVVILE